MAWTWVDKGIVQAVHTEQIAEHGGQPGVRDDRLLESALARPINRAAYEDATVSGLAAAYGFGIARNHPFLDGNKRTALVVMELFLALNGYDLTADDAACLHTTVALADGSMSEEALAAWLKEYACQSCDGGSTSF